jgi:hypothetical protein
VHLLVLFTRNLLRRTVIRSLKKKAGYYKFECDIGYEETVDVYKQKYDSSNQEVQLLINSCKNKCNRKTTKFLRKAKGCIKWTEFIITEKN